ncbi:fatty acyl-CoA reductase wat-like isoform X2 [Vespula squamosa]|uniref:Fatty acyl-CoA reductase wat-like isoform X2 n=1 Tax=Vespula squamosa TaxID=30214 RepID=A0ABD2CA24_VESSQ
MILYNNYRNGPNIYVNTKSVTKDKINKHIGSIPIGMFRQLFCFIIYHLLFRSIILIKGSVEIIVDATVALIRSIHYDRSINVDLVRIRSQPIFPFRRTFHLDN